MLLLEAALSRTLMWLLFNVWPYDQFQVWSMGLTIAVSTSQYKLKTCRGCWVSGIPWNINKASVRVWRMGGDGSFHGTPQCSFTLTLYSLDVVTVNLSISFPALKKGTYEGVELSSRVHSVRSAPHHRSSPVQGPHHTNINSSLSGPPSRFFFLSHPFHFPEEENLRLDLVCVPIFLSLSPSVILLSLSTDIRTRVFFSSYFVLNYCYFL